MKKVLLIGLIILMVACEQNHAPVIQRINCIPAGGKPGTVFTLSVAATDEDGDELEYSWSANGGAFTDSTHLAETNWQSPLSGSGSTFTIGVSVSDGENTVTSTYPLSISINLAPVVSDFRPYPTTDVGGAQFIIKVVASDPDNDPLTYAWSCAEGEFTGEINRSLVRWQSPLNQQDKIYSLAVEIRDGINKTDTVLQINVLKSPGGDLFGNTFFTGCLVPVAGAKLTVADHSAISDANGRFEIKDIPFGTHQAEATKTDFNTATQSVIITSGGTTESVFHLSSVTYTGQVHGAIRDQDGKSVTGAIIVLLNPDQTESYLTTTSDAQGNYTLEDIPKGDRILLARKNPDDSYRYNPVQNEVSLSGSDLVLNIEIQSFSLVPFVVTQPASIVSYNFATIGGEVTYAGESPIIKRGVCWSDAPSPTILSNCTSNGIGMGSFESSLIGLNAGSTYYVRAYATNSNGKTGYGEEILISTTPYEMFTDSRDQKTYKAVNIGGQTWMAENLNYVASSGSWCYEGKSSYCDLYGRLYDYNRATNIGAGKVCPAGWRVPTFDEWNILINFLGSNPGYQLKSGSGWASNGNGSNSVGFNAKPGGSSHDGNYSGLTTNSTLNSSSNQITTWKSATTSNVGYYLRCLKD